MKHPSHFFVFLLAILSFSFTISVHHAKAAPVYTTGLIKGSGDTVYFKASNDARLVFPNEKTFKTWYSGFSSVTTISDSELASISLRGNVTYRSGVKLIKITTDPKVYAVGRNGTLRWVTTEAIATELYGNDWSTKVDDVPDAYFVNYHIGAPINAASEYSPSEEMNKATDIITDQLLVLSPLPAPSAPTSTSPTSTPPTSPPSAPSSTGVLFTTSKTTVQAGDTITLQVYASDTLAVTSIELFFDGGLIKTCTSITCTADIQIPLAGTKTSYIVEGRVSTLNQTLITKTVTVLVTQDASPLAKLAITQSVIRPDQLAGVSIEADVSIAVNRIDIYVDGSNIKSCASTARVCSWSGTVSGSIGSTHPVYGIVKDTLGRSYISPTQSITLSANDAPGVTVSPAKSVIYLGETVDITVTATDNEGIASIDVLYNGNVLKHCDSGAPCTATTGPWNTLGSITFSGRATDPNGTVGSGDSSAVSVIVQP